ncbi:MAG TPA: response regulator [Rubrobacter sp.]|nr:response regulator [Rubrobacter sp.]
MVVGPRILIVEDHLIFSEALEFLLGHRLLEEHVEQAEFRRAATVAEGLDLVNDDGPFDMAILDPILPDGNGVEVLGEIKASHPRTRVAVLGPVPDLSGALEAGADEAIGKETPILEMISHLACLARGGDRTAAPHGIAGRRDFTVNRR